MAATAKQRKKILVVEDDEKISLSLAIRLNAAGYDVVTASDSTHGISKFTNEKPDLVVLDVMMPAGGGLFVAGCIQDDPKAGAVPIVFLTASREPGLRRRASEVGGSAFLEKPYEAADLLATVERLLAAREPVPV